MWEDDSNKSGGRLSLKLNKTYSGLIWEETLISVTARLFTQKMNENINGVMLSVRKSHDVLQIWFKNFNDEVKFSLEYLLFNLGNN